MTGLDCPVCEHPYSTIYQMAARTRDGGNWRYRECKRCHHSWKTREIAERELIELRRKVVALSHRNFMASECRGWEHVKVNVLGRERTVARIK